jgi:hypothetical protein
MNNELERIERILALLLLETLKTAPQREKAWKLNQAGFSNVEIAELLNTKPAVIATHIYDSKKAKTKNKS